MSNNLSMPLNDRAIGAMLGAAYGDALGWPNELRSRSTSKKQTVQGSIQQFKSWVRRSGGRFFPHEEIIEAGEYSDDTQLILCLSRSLLHGDNWWEYWATIELPFWTLYERGGGGATKRAADSWVDGRAPWAKSRNQKDVTSYFGAGGNGVAMRILPHVLYYAQSDSFEPIALNIFRDGIVTHGHPRALVGAIAYGYALWRCARRESRLEYGAIVEELLDGVKDWSSIPNSFEKTHSDWLIAANQNMDDYQLVWNETVREMVSFLLICKDELSKGALAFDDDALRQLKCFDSKVSGSGTVAAAASVFLASRYAPDPINGVVKAAFAIGSDTDTIASMTGGMLGLICGSDWLSAQKNRIQDAKYLAQIAQDVLKQQKQIRSRIGISITRKHLQDWIDALMSKPNNYSVVLPDQRKGIVSCSPDQIGRSGKYKVQFRKLTCECGQTVYLTKIAKGNFNTLDENRELFDSLASEKQLSSKANGHTVCGPKIIVESFDKAIQFYRNFLGLTIKRQSHDVVVFDQGLVLVPKSYVLILPEAKDLRALVYVQTTDIRERFLQIERNGTRMISKLAPWGKTEMLHFSCLDPDGNIVEVFQQI